MLLLLFLFAVANIAMGYGLAAYFGPWEREFLVTRPRLPARWGALAGRLGRRKKQAAG